MSEDTLPRSQSGNPNPQRIEITGFETQVSIRESRYKEMQAAERKLARVLDLIYYEISKESDVWNKLTVIMDADAEGGAE